jgi:hypothetical protein
VLHRALQLAGTMPASSAAAVPSATAAVSASVDRNTAAQQQQQQGWRLASFSSKVPGAAELLLALPANSVPTWTSTQAAATHAIMKTTAPLQQPWGV